MANQRYYEFIFLGSKDGDLRDFKVVNSLFEKYKPTLVVHLASRVGGLFANMNDKVGFLEDNIQMNNNIIKCSHLFEVKRLICALSSCIFPDDI